MANQSDNNKAKCDKYKKFNKQYNFSGQVLQHIHVNFCHQQQVRHNISNNNTKTNFVNVLILLSNTRHNF